MRIVLADDEKRFTLAVANCLRKRGHEVYVVNESVQVVEVVRQRRPDLILLDVYWYVEGSVSLAQPMQGIDILDALKRESLWNPKQVVAMSAKLDHKDHVELGEFIDGDGTPLIEKSGDCEILLAVALKRISC